MKPTISLRSYYDLYLVDAALRAMRPKIGGATQGIVYDEAGVFSSGLTHIHTQKQRSYLKAEQLFAQLSFDFGHAIRDYVVLACMGEARHAWGKADYILKEIPKTYSRNQVYKLGYKFDPQDTLEKLITVFSFGWGGGYGGPKWVAIAKAGLMFPTVTPFLFADHCVDLEHNGGCVFDKTSTVEVTGFKLDIDSSDLKYFLDWKLNYNILEDEPKGGVTATFHPSVARMVTNYYRLWKRTEVPHWLHQRFVAEPYALDYTPIQYEGAFATLIGKQQGKVVTEIPLASPPKTLPGGKPKSVVSTLSAAISMANTSAKEVYAGYETAIEHTYTREEGEESHE